MKWYLVAVILLVAVMTAVPTAIISSAIIRLDRMTSTSVKPALGRSGFRGEYAVGSIVITSS